MNARERKRQRLQEIRRIPTTVASFDGSQGKSLGGVVEVEGYLASRQEQLRNIERALLSSGSAIGKRIFQSLPRYLRRRATSHNVRRLPIALRKHAIKEIDKPRVKRPVFISRRQRRRKQLWNGKNTATVRINRLKTHLWHAKRMKMIDIWGWRLALRPTEKCFRRLYKSSIRSCTIHDASYRQCVEISGQQPDCVATFLTPFLSPFAKSLILHFTAGNRFGQTFIHAPHRYPADCWGPIEYQWIPVDTIENNNNGRCSLWIWIHPSFARNALPSLQEHAARQPSIQIRPIGSEMISRFELRGPTSNSVLHQVLSLATPSPLWDRLKPLHSTSCLPSGAVVALRVRPPMENFPVRMPTRETLNNEVNATDLELSTDLLTGKQWPQPACELRLLKGTTDNDGDDGDEDKEKDSFTIYLQQDGLDNGRQKDAGWNILLPTKHARTLWISLIFAGAKARGLRELYCAALEAQQPCFPNDYPDTAAYRSYTDQFIVAERLRKHCRLPPAKRPNYERMGVESPFAPPFPAQAEMFVLRDRRLLRRIDKLLLSNTIGANSKEQVAELETELQREFPTTSAEAWLTARVFLIGKGVPASGAAIFSFNDETIELQRQVEEALCNPDKPLPSIEWRAVQQLMSDNDTIGYITSGAASLRLGHGFGIGHVRLEALFKNASRGRSNNKDDNNNNNNNNSSGLRSLFLLHNTESTSMRPCFIQLCL